MTKRIPPCDAPAFDWLRSAGACCPGLDWVTLNGIATVGQAWEQCSEPGWLLWGLDAVRWPARAMTGLACWFVRHTTLPGDRPFTDLLTDPRSRRALKAAEGWVSHRYGDRELWIANEAAWDAVMEAPCYGPADPGYAACIVAYHASEVAVWVSAVDRESEIIPAVRVHEHLVQSVRWVAIQDGRNPDVAMRGAMAVQLDGIRRLIVDPWQTQAEGGT